MSEPADRATPTRTDVDVIVVGAGFAGLYAIYRLRAAKLSVQCFEAGDGVGGTWYWNRYPGARCDVESVDYSYSFSPELQQEWNWTERYASQPEILRYLEHVADRFQLRDHIRLGTRVTAATLDDDTGAWTVTIDSGEVSTARYVVMATGALSTPNLPDLGGIEKFEGRILHTGAWPHDEVDFTGRRVAVVGTGSSGVQSIPKIAAQAEHLYVLQRTPNFSVPARNSPLDSDSLAAVKADYDRRRAMSWASGGGTPYLVRSDGTFDVDDDERTRIYEQAWANGGARFAKIFPDQMIDPMANQLAADFAHEKIRSVVTDPEVVQRLLPRDHPIGAKRICVDTHYFETYNRDNVTLIDLRAQPDLAFTESSIRAGDAEYLIDDVVLATGYDALTGTLNRIDIEGRDGVRLRESWAQRPVTYLGLSVPGFPNLFIVSGPGSPSVLTNMVLAAEQHVDWIAAAVDHLRLHGLSSIEATPEAAHEWVTRLDEMAGRTLAGAARSWYTGANIEGKPRVFMPYIGGFGVYCDECRAVVSDGYRGFALS